MVFCSNCIDWGGEGRGEVYVILLKKLIETGEGGVFFPRTGSPPTTIKAEESNYKEK